MRIAHVYAVLDPAHGGPPIVVDKLSAIQTELGHDVRVVAEHGQLDNAAMITLVSPHSALSLLRKPRSEDLGVVKWADIVHLHGMWQPLLPCIARAAREAGVPYVVSPHGMLDPWSLAQKRWKKRFALALGYHQMLNRASVVHVLNADEQRLIEPLNVTAPFEIIPIGIAWSDFDPLPSPSAFQHQYPAIASGPFILFVSRLHPKKGLDYLADAFQVVASRHPTCQLVVAGPDGGAEMSFRSRIAQHGLTDRVHGLGFLSDEMKRSALAAATVYCLPSRQEGFSMAVLEAMACRTAVVISDQCHFPEVAEVGAGRVTRLNVESIATALDEVLSNASERARMGEIGRALVASRFTWPIVAKRFVDLYVKLVKSNNPSAILQ